MTKIFCRVSFSCATVLAISFFPGCESIHCLWDIDRCADIPRGAIPAPVGSQVCAWQTAQVASASIDLGAFYQCEFIGETSQLAPSGIERVAMLSQRNLLQSIPLFVEPTGNPNRDADRQRSVAQAFAQIGIPMTEDQIFIEKPPALGMEGFRAQRTVSGSLGRGSGGGQGGSSGGQGGTGAGSSSSGSGFGGGGIF